MRQIREEQLEPALALEPDLVSIIGGLNDILRPRIDFRQVVGDLEHMVSAFATRGATVLGVTFPDAARIMPAARLARRRVSALNLAVRRDRRPPRDADRRPRAPRRRRSPACGRWTACMPTLPGTRGSPPPWSRHSDSSPARIHGRHFRRPTRSPAARRSRTELVWMSRHMAPWIVRRIRGRSSGDGLAPKRPALAPLSRPRTAKRPPNSLESDGRRALRLSQRALRPRCGARRARACPPAGPARAPRALAPARPRSRAPNRSAEASSARHRRGQSAGG